MKYIFAWCLHEKIVYFEIDLTKIYLLGRFDVKIFDLVRDWKNNSFSDGSDVLYLVRNKNFFQIW